MTTKNVQLKDLSGNLLNPKTLGSIVINNAGKDLGGVEENAQVNVLEGIKYNGTALTVDANKDIALPVFSLKKLTNADTGYSADFAAQYILTKDGAAVGDTINLAKDMVISAGELKYCETEDDPVEGLDVGDPYLDLTIANAASSHIYIPVKGLVDVYTAGAGLDLANGEFSVDTTDTDIVDAAPTASSTKFVQSGGVYTALAGKVDANSAITAGTKCKITYDTKGLVTGGADLAESDIPNLASSKINLMTGYTKGSAVAAIAATDTLNDAIGKLEYKVDGKQDTITGAATSIVSNDLTASKILVSDSNGKVAASSIAADAALLVWEELPTE